MGTEATDMFKASGDNDTVISYGGADNDHIKLVDLRFSLFDGGTVSDILDLDGNLNLDLSILRDKISGIETISFMEEVHLDQ